MNDNHVNEEVLRLITQGNELSYNNDFFHARQCFSAARTLAPNNKQIKIAALNNDALWYRRKSRLHNRQEYFALAIALYHKVLALSPDDVHALFSIGILMRQTDSTAALKYLDKALALQPNNAKIWEVKGRCYRELKDIPSELECYYAVQKIEPSVMIQRGIDNAKSRLRKASIHDPELKNYLIKILNSEGLHHVIAENYDAALECYREAVSLEPESVLAQNNMIDVLLKRSEQLMRFRRFDEARADVEQVLQMNSSHEVALRCTAQNARTDLMEEISERKKQSISRTTSANDFWASEREGAKRSLSSDVSKDDNTRTLKQHKQ